MTAPAETTYTFRAIVRGQDERGIRVRRCRNIEATSYESAWMRFGEHAEDMAAGLTDTSYSVLPPVGWRVDGTVSTGYMITQ